jgi:hypothetical protein
MKTVGAGFAAALVVLALGMNLHAATGVNCGAALGAKFNLEPATNAQPQELESVDFIPNGVGLNEDLVVASAFDSRGVVPFGGPPPTKNWDGSVSGYYVSRSTTSNCVPQFEGGLPTITTGGNSFGSLGGVSIAADPARNTFFAADQRFAGGVGTAIGLFRASAATLLNSTLCPNGTHTAAQATSCWSVTPPALTAIGVPDDFPSIAVDERPTGAGTGAGDVYIVVANSSASNLGVALLACTNSTLSCSAPVTASAKGENIFITGGEDTYVQVRPDGKITVTYIDQTDSNDDSPVEDIRFVMCTPSGAPHPPVCSAPKTVATETQAIETSISNQALSSEDFFAWTQARHAHRLEADGKTITTFVVWDRCAEYFNFITNVTPNLPALCLNADVVMSTSSDGGNTWSKVTGVNTGEGHQFFPWISTDDSTGTVNIVYYDTEMDFFHKRMSVALNQIAPGTTTVGKTTLLTTKPIAWDADPNQTAIPLDDMDFHLGMKARGMGSTGNSRVYATFTSTGDREGTYQGGSLPEQNNNLQEFTY